VDPSRSGQVRNISPPQEFDLQTAWVGRSPFTAPQTQFSREVKMFDAVFIKVDQQITHV